MSEQATAPQRPTEKLAAVQMTVHDDGVTHIIKCPDCGRDHGQIVFGEGASIEDERNAIASLDPVCAECNAKVHDYEQVPAIVAADMTEAKA